MQENTNNKQPKPNQPNIPKSKKRKQNTQKQHIANKQTTSKLKKKRKEIITRTKQNSDENTEAAVCHLYS